MPRFVHVLQQGEDGIDRIQQPEVRNVGRAELRQTQILLPSRGRQLRALGRQDLHQLPANGVNARIRPEIEQRWRERVVEFKRAFSLLVHPAHAQRRGML